MIISATDTPTGNSVLRNIKPLLRILAIYIYTCRMRVFCCTDGSLCKATPGSWSYMLIGGLDRPCSLRFGSSFSVLVAAMARTSRYTSAESLHGRCWLAKEKHVLTAKSARSQPRFLLFLTIKLCWSIRQTALLRQIFIASTTGFRIRNFCMEIRRFSVFQSFNKDLLIIFKEFC